jgi:MauM/NapG family ferredoxin protein
LEFRGDRRDALRSAFNQMVERMVDATEERLAPRRYVRPPGALPELGFLAACTRCGDCIPVCPVRAIVRAPTEAGLAAGTPYLNVQVQACIACADMPCARACPTEALTVPPHGWDGYRLGAVEFVPERCVTYKGVACQVCAKACPVGERALAIDSDGHPVLKLEGCVGCGSCVKACITSPSSFLFKAAGG